MPRTQCQATALGVLCRHTGPPARRWRGAGPCHGPLSHPTASSGPTGPWGRPAGGRHLGPCSHAPHPQRCSRSTTGRGRGRYASSSATVGCQETSGCCGVGQGPLSSPYVCRWHCMARLRDVARDDRFPFPTGTSNELRPSLRPLRRAARVAHASRTSREGSRLPWSRHRRDGFVLDASFVPFGTVLSYIVDDGPWARGVTNLCSGSLLAPAA